MIPLADDAPARRFPVVTLSLIALNALLYLIWQARIGIGASVALGALVPASLTGDVGGRTFGTVLSSMFLHGGLLHLAGNMWFLWIFGNNVEDVLRPARYLLFYLLCGIAAALTHVIATPQSLVPLVGASGAVSGVLGAYLIRFPRARLTLLTPIPIIFPIIRIPAPVFLLFWIGFQVAAQRVDASRHGPASGGIAYLAHIGGFIAGIGLLPLLTPRR